MSVVAKFRCVEVKKNEDHSDERNDPVLVRLQAVFGGENDEANRSWSKWTPSGELFMSITNPAAHAEFKTGRCYFITVAEAPEVPKAE